MELLNHGNSRLFAVEEIRSFRQVVKIGMSELLSSVLICVSIKNAVILQVFQLAYKAYKSLSVNIFDSGSCSNVLELIGQESLGEKQSFPSISLFVLSGDQGKNVLVTMSSTGIPGNQALKPVNGPARDLN